MKKMNYIQPQMEVEQVCSDAFVMLLDSGSGPQPAPAHQVAPEVPGGSL